MIRDVDRLETLLAEIRRFVRDECIPIEEQVDRCDEIPEALVERMRQIGLFGHSIPQAYGGAGLTTEELARVNIEVSQAATVFRARFGGNTGIASESLVVDGTPAQKEKYLPLLASGRVTGCFALTDSPDPLGMPMQQVLTGDVFAAVHEYDDPRLIYEATGQSVFGIERETTIADQFDRLVMDMSSAWQRLRDLAA